MKECGANGGGESYRGVRGRNKRGERDDPERRNAPDRHADRGHSCLQHGCQGSTTPFVAASTALMFAPGSLPSVALPLNGLLARRLKSPAVGLENPTSPTPGAKKLPAG